MATTVLPSKIKPNQVVGPTSRYSSSDVIYWGPQNKITFTTYLRKTYSRSERDRWTVVDASEEFRPDKVAFRSYGVQNLWWAVMEANGLKDIWDFRTGLNLWLPDNIY